MKTKKKEKTPEAKAIDTLVKLIEAYAEVSRADEMKGGGDPDAIPVIAAELELARAKLNAQLEHLRRLLA